MIFSALVVVVAYLVFLCCFLSIPIVPIDQEPKTYLKYPKTQLPKPMGVFPLEREENTIL